MQSQLLLKINTLQMESFLEQYQWGLLVPELMEMIH